MFYYHDISWGEIGGSGGCVEMFIIEHNVSYSIECDCGPHGKCSLESGIKRCTCDSNYAEKNGKCEYCSCGENSKSCHYNVLGEKECNCYSAYAQNRGYCEDCNCGPYGSCSFEYNRKRCNCESFAINMNGVCVVMESTTLEGSTSTMTTALPLTTQYKGTSSSEGTTDSTTTSTIVSSTVRACDCGLGGSCHLDSSGDKICYCFSGYARYKGHCYECDCGPYGTCIIDAGIKRCTCDVNYAEKNGKCESLDKGTSSSELTTVSTTTSTIGSSTAH
ncbi:hypothetical protein AVEN_104760-1, partial [Araneus ventricosus]